MKRLSDRQKVWLLFIVAYAIAAAIGCALIFGFRAASAAAQEVPMCIDPQCEATAKQQDTDPVTELLAAIEAARDYTQIQTPRARQRLKQAGMVNQPPIDYNAPELARLRRAIAAIAPVSEIEVALR